MEKKTSILDIIKSRRSTRRFKPDMVPDEDLNAVLEAARFAPSGENKQPWKFIVIKNRDIMMKIVDLSPLKRFYAFLRNGPILIAILVNSKKSKWAILDGAICTQNLMLEAWARGLGTCFSSWYPTMPDSIVKEVKELLNIPDHWIIITFTPLGYPIDDPKRAHILPAKRKPLEQLICYERFEL
ncbi:MAG: nitroreductase family protein [Candidatus Hodarchaeota archaeon]